MAFTALLDACVLYPASLRDTLLRVAEAGVYRPRWTEEILAEVRRNLLDRYPDLEPARVDAMFQQMGDAFEGAAVTGYEGLIRSMTNAPKDRHVLAAAVVGRVDVIVTHNVRDFPPEACDPYGIDVQTPDEFLIHAFWLDPDGMVEVLERQAGDKTSPPMTLVDIVGALERSAPDFAREVRTSIRADRP